MRVGGLVILVLLASPAQAAWTQHGGDAAHSRAADWRDLDVVQSMRLRVGNFTSDSDGRQPLLVVESPYGILAFGRESAQPSGSGSPGVPVGQCRIMATALDGTDPYGDLPNGPGSMPCNSGGRLLGYDPVGNLVLYAIAAAPDKGLSPAVVFAWNLTTGREQFRLGPPGDEAPADVGSPFRLAVAAWRVDVVAMDIAKRILVVAMSPDDGHDNLLVHASLRDGAVAWTTQVEPQFFNKPTFHATSVTMTDRGILVEGVHSAGYCMVWFTREGDYVAGRCWIRTNDPNEAVAEITTALNEEQIIDRSSGGPAHSLHSGGDGSRVVTLLGGSILTIQPERSGVEVVALEGELPSGTVVAAPAVRDHTTAVPLRRGVAFLDERTAELRIWPGDRTSIVQDILLGPNHALVLMAADALDLQATYSVDLYVVDLATATTERRIPVPLPLAPFDVFDRVAFLTPLADGGVLAWSVNYDAVRLGAAAVAPPEIRVSDAYAALGQPIELDWTPTSGSTLVSWGDGSDQQFPPGQAEATHVYLAAGTYPIHVTAIDEEGRTATADTLAHPGQPRPTAELSFLQTAFSPENQNLTFGVLGIALTVVGALVAALARLRRRSRVAFELEALDALKDQGRTDPIAAVVSVAQFRSRLRADLARGRLDDSQFSALELDVRELLQLLRQRVLGDVRGHLSHPFTNALDVALQDGRLEHAERNALTAALAREKLTAHDRVRLTHLIETWPA